MSTSRSSFAIVTAALTMLVAGSLSYAQAPGAATKPTMTAKLVDPEKKAAEKAATVEVTVSGVELTDAAISHEKAVPGQGHLHYQLDEGAVVATPTAKLTYHELTPGTHTILVVLSGNDHQPLGPQQQLTVTVPQSPSATSTSGTSGTAPKPDAAAKPGTEKPKSGY